MEETFSKEDSLSLITKMINQAKNENSEKGEGWLLWGWLLFLASISSAILMHFKLGSYLPWLWNAMGITVVVYFIYGVTLKKTAPVKTYVEEMLDRFGIGFFISLITIIICSAIINNGFAFGYYFILYAFWMYIYGSAIKFKPLIIGAIVNWAAAILIFIVDDFKYGMIISAVAVLLGYLIPGYMLRNQFRKSSQKKTNGV